MIRAWRKELLCVGVVLLVLTLLGLLSGEPLVWFQIGLLVYLGWHLINFFLLQIWIGGRKGFRLPVSLGIWEAVFDGLQRERLQKRRRGRQLVASLSDCREAAGILPDAMVFLSQDGAIRWFNPAARKLLGLRWPTDRGRKVTKILAHPILEDDLAKGHSSRPLEVPSPANGAWMLSIQITAPFGNQLERLLLARNITPVYRLEQARRDFLASVSHELRTPITVFRGYLEALQDAARDHPDWRTPVRHMDMQVQRMQSLVDDLLILSRLEMADRPRADTPVPVPEILAEVVAAARTLSGEQKHDLRLDADPTLWLVGEDDALHSAFSNLIFNAVRHTPPGTRVDVIWQRDGANASFAVRDKGPGIAAYHLPRLTERFYRVEAGRSRHSGGSGLGMAIVKQALERHGAELKITSQIGEGSLFAIRFPASMVEIEQPALLSHAG